MKVQIGKYKFDTDDVIAAADISHADDINHVIGCMVFLTDDRILKLDEAETRQFDKLFNVDPNDKYL